MTTDKDRPCITGAREVAGMVTFVFLYLVGDAIQELALLTLGGRKSRAGNKRER